MQGVSCPSAQNPLENPWKTARAISIALFIVFTINAFSIVGIDIHGVIKEHGKNDQLHDMYETT